MGIIQDIFREYSPAYLQKYGERIPQAHRKVIDAILFMSNICLRHDRV